MAFCAKCGAQLADGSLFCANCGAPLQQQAPIQQYQQAPVQQYQQAPNQQYRQAPNQKAPNQQKSFFDTPDHTAEMHPNDIAQNKVMGILAYIGLLVLIPIFAAPQSKFARFHANQGLIVDIAAVTLSILSSVLMRFIPVLGILFVLLDLPVIGLQVLGIINAASGKAKELPLVGGIKILN